jgi:hypothetical protein
LDETVKTGDGRSWTPKWIALLDESDDSEYTIWEEKSRRGAPAPDGPYYFLSTKNGLGDAYELSPEWVTGSNPVGNRLSYGDMSFLIIRDISPVTAFRQ